MISEKYRPQNLNDITGQERLTGPNGILTQMLAQNRIQSCIFFGPPGCGKTTTARILASQSGLPYVSLNATNAKLEDIRTAVKNTSGTVLLYLDEIQYFNRKQQQSLLPYIENGEIILIGATTDNPYYCCYDALLSRCVILEFHPVPASDIADLLISISAKEQKTLEPNAARMIAENASGDVRRALNALDLLFLQNKTAITAQDVENSIPSVNMSGFDSNSDIHYNLISALQKSIRGSDPNAAVFYLARLLEGGDILSPCRRLLVIAHEDIGMGNPDAAAYVLACTEAAKQLGMPEAAKPLTNAVIYLAISPKCSTAENTYNPAAEDIHNGKGGTVPVHLTKAGQKRYKYPHAYPNHWVPQQYLPDDLRNRVYYVPGDNAFEQNMATYWNSIMSMIRPENR